MSLCWITGDLNGLIYLVKKISDSPIIPVHFNKSQIFYHKRLIFNKISSPSRQFLPSWPRPRSPWLPSATSGVVLNLYFSFFDPNFGYFGQNMIFLGQKYRFKVSIWTHGCAHGKYATCPWATFMP